jgi:hypothetical protein
MSKTIQHKRSSIAGNKPDDTQIAVGELAINFPDRILYTKDADGEVIPLIGEIEIRPLEGGTILSEPTNTQPAGPVEWKGAGGRILTASYPLVISDDGYNFTDKIETTDNDTEIWTKWAGEPGSNNGIDGPHGTTITGTVSDGLGGSQSFELTIAKETSFVFQNSVDSDQPVGGASESRVVTVHSVNSYVYPYGSTTAPTSDAQYATNGGDFRGLPISVNPVLKPNFNLIAGDEVQLRHTNASSNNTASTYTFKAAGDSADWTTVTADIVPTILQPTIESPATDGELSISPNGPFRSSDFEMAEGTDTHTASSWAIVDLSGNVAASLDSDATALTSWEPTGLEGNKDYTVKVKHHTASLNSEWSEERSFRTDYLPGQKWTFQDNLGIAMSSGITSAKGIAWSGTQFVAVGGGENLHQQNWPGGMILNSPDGVTWTLNDKYLSTPLITVAYSPELSLFVAQGWWGSTYTSSDGVTWTSVASPPGVTEASRHSVIWAPELSLFVSVGDGGAISYSSDGITWTAASGSAYGQVLFDVAWNGSMFCAVGGKVPQGSWDMTNIGEKKFKTSTDGVNWTPGNDNLETAVGAKETLMTSIAWSPELSIFCTVGEGGECATSPDGTTWTNQPSLASAWGNDVSPPFTGGQTPPVSYNSGGQVIWNSDANHFIAVGRDGLCATSSDGVTWTNQPSLGAAVAGSSDKKGIMRAVVWDGTQYCAVGDYGYCATSS